MSGKNLRASVIIGGGISSSFRSAMSSAKYGLKKIGDEIVRVEQKQRVMAQHAETFRRMGRDAERAQQQYASLAQTAEKLRAAQSRVALANDRVERNRTARTEVGGQLRGATATFGAVAATAFFPIREAVKFETAMLGVAKQVNGARDASGKLTPVYFDMAKQIQRLGRELPVATNDIADMVTAGARMGIANDQLITFVRNASMMSTAFDMPAGELSENMGKIAGIFKIPVPAIGELGDAINNLDDNAISKGSDIIRVLQGDLAGAATTMGLSAKNTAALASTFLHLGESAERADTAAAGMLRQLQIAKMNPKRFQVGVQMLGMTADQLQKGMVDDPQAMILDVLGRIKKLPVEQQMEAVTRLFGKDWGGAIAKLANGVDEYRRQLDLANGSAAKGSMSREFQARMQTTAAQWQLTKNRMTEVAVVIGGALLPAVNDLMKDAAPAIEAFAAWSREHPGFIKGVVGSALALSGLRVVTLGIRYAWLSVATPILKAQQLFARFRAFTAIAKAGGEVGRFGSTLLRVGSIVRTVGAVIGAIGGGPIALIVGALTVGALLVRKYWEPIKAFVGGAVQGVSAAFSDAFGEFSAALSPLKPAWDAISSAAGQFFGWIGKLLAPVNMTGAELQGATSAGQKFGAMLGFVMTGGIRVITGVVKAVTWLGTAIGETAGWIVVTFGNAWDKVKSTVGSAVDWIMGKIAPLVRAGAAVAGALGFGGATPASASPTGAAPRAAGRPSPIASISRPSGRVPVALRTLSTATPGRSRDGSTSNSSRNAAPVVNDHRQYEIKLTQQPGEDARSLARRMREEIRLLDEADHRSRIGD